MTALVTASERDLRILAGIVSDDRDDLPAEGLPPSLLADLMSQIRCDFVTFEEFDSRRQEGRGLQEIPSPADEEDDAAAEARGHAHREHYLDCLPCSYPDRTGDLRSVLKIADFYSARQWHSTGMYNDVLPAAGARARSPAVPAHAGPGPGARADRAADLSPRARPGLHGARPRCWPCCARTCTRPTWTPSAAATPSPSSPPGTGTC